MRYTVAVDFDGVLHSYTTPWFDAKTIPDPPVPGAIEWLNKISQHFDIVIHTTRSATREGQLAVVAYLRGYGLTLRSGDPLIVTDRKLPALLYIDDRGYRFDGSNFPTRDEIHKMRPWNKKLGESIPQTTKNAYHGEIELRVARRARVALGDDLFEGWAWIDGLWLHVLPDDHLHWHSWPAAAGLSVEWLVETGRDAR